MPIPDDLWAQALACRADVAAAMIGRMGDPMRPAAAVAAAASVLAGPGDCCETGVLWGGSLLTTALLRRRLGLAGLVVGVDPFDGYYMRDARLATPNERMFAPVTADTVRENARRLGVEGDIQLVAQPSHPWPEPLADWAFVFGFIDGDHWGDGPFHDFTSLAARGARVVAFDNYPTGSSDDMADVACAVERALAAAPGWALAFVQDGVAVLERVVPEEGRPCTS